MLHYHANLFFPANPAREETQNPDDYFPEATELLSNQEKIIKDDEHEQNNELLVYTQTPNSIFLETGAGNNIQQHFQIWTEQQAASPTTVEQSTNNIARHNGGNARTWVYISSPLILLDENAAHGARRIIERRINEFLNRSSNQPFIIIIPVNYKGRYHNYYNKTRKQPKPTFSKKQS